MRCSTTTSVSMILLDTSVLIWLLGGSTKLGSAARDFIEARHPVYYSSISILEMTIKAMKGRLEVRDDICADLDDLGLRQMPLIGEHVEFMREFVGLSTNDPFDRALLAQASAEGLVFVTSDRAVLSLGRPWIIDAAT